MIRAIVHVSAWVYTMCALASAIGGAVGWLPLWLAAFQALVLGVIAGTKFGRLYL